MRRHSINAVSAWYHFNPRTHEGCDRGIIAHGAASGISIHAPTRGATVTHGGRAYRFEISIHAPTRGATQENSLSKSLKTISIHAPTRGATFAATDCPGPYLISIHAPTRGATLSQLPLSQPYTISIHAPTRGATLVNRQEYRGRKFQSTHPRGVRRSFPDPCPCVHDISIHAPTRGATSRHSWLTQDTLNFNPRTHEGCDYTADYRRSN